MINANDEVKLTGVVSATGTGEFTVQVSEFYVDEAWHKLVSPRDIVVQVADYNDDLTSLELDYIRKQAEEDSKSSTLCDDDMEIVKSIVKKLTVAPSAT